MTFDERAQAFQLEYADLCNKHGVVLQAVFQPITPNSAIQVEPLGAVVQVEPALAVAEITGWQSPPEPPQLNGKTRKAKVKESG